MLDAKEQGRSAPRKAPSYLSPNQGIDPLTWKGALTDGRSPSFISAPSGDIAHYTLLRKVVRASTAFVRTKCGTHVLDGDTPYPVIRTKDSAYNGNLWRVPITAQSSTDATDHDALQPLRGSEADCVRSPIRQSIPSRPQHRSSGGRTAPEEMGRSPIFDKRG